ncbi:MAG TPA: alpha/beta fold hydrolase [Vicinamibacterales bacterium]
MTLARVQRRLLQAAAIVIFLVLAGATYQGVATALERREFPHPGRLVDVGGHQLHLSCTGEGSPTVVLEAPAAGMSAAWGWIQPEIAETTRVCSYDRAGLGWSEAGDLAFDPATVAEQLHVLLEKSGERGPYVLAGQGLGAALALLDAKRLGDRAVALVAIDRPATAEPSERARATRLVTMSPWLARAGVLRATTMLSARATGLPEPSQGALRAFLNRPDHLTRAARELVRWDDIVTLASSVALPTSMHLTEIRAGQAGGVDFLTDAAAAAPVARTILDAVAAVRGQSTEGSRQ